MKKILILGCGSIGSRHARNARSLGVEVVLVDSNAIRVQQLAGEIQTNHTYSSIEEALAVESDVTAVIIATPSQYHVAGALTALKSGLPVFMEKPLATSLEGIAELVALAKEKEVVTMMGQSFRFHAGFLRVKEYIDAGKLGRVFHAQFSGGEYLPDWHPDQDYRTEYAAQRALGGGVLFTSMSHLIDIIEWLFGPIDVYAGWKDRLGSLDIDVDDLCVLFAKTKQNVIVTGSSNFIERPHRNEAFIIGEKGRLTADFINNQLSFVGSDGSIEIETYEFDGNERYVKELSYFMRLIDLGKADETLDLNHGAHIVRLLCDSRVKDLVSNEP